MTTKIFFFILFSIVTFTSILYAADPPKYHKIIVKVNNIYVLSGGTFSGTFSCDLFRQYKEEVEILSNGHEYEWEDERITTKYFNVFNSPLQIETSYQLLTSTEIRSLDPTGSGNYEPCEVTMLNRWIQHHINFNGDENYDIVYYTEEHYSVTHTIGGGNKSEKASQPDPIHYYDHYYEYDIYLMETPEGYQVETQEIEVSENLLNSVLSNNLYTNFPYTFSNRTYLAEFGLPNIELLADATNGVIRLTAPIQFNYNSTAIACTVKIEFTPSMMNVDWLPQPFGSFYAYCIVLNELNLNINTNIVLQNVPAGIPSNVLTALKNEINDIDANDFKIPLYPKIIFNETFQIQQISATVNLTYLVIPPKILNDKMLFNVWGQYTVTQ